MSSANSQLPSPSSRPVYTPSVFELVLHVQKLRNGSLVLIDGASGTGKTTLASELERAFCGGDAPVVIHMDDLYPGWDGLEQGIRNLHDWILLPRADKQPVAWKRYDWEIGAFVDEVTLDMTKTVIVEGCGTLGLGAHVHADLAIWVSADEALRRTRALGRNPAEDFVTHWGSWDDQFTRYVERDAPSTRANVHVRSDG